MNPNRLRKKYAKPYQIIEPVMSGGCWEPFDEYDAPPYEETRMSVLDKKYDLEKHMNTPDDEGDVCRELNAVTVWIE